MFNCLLLNYSSSAATRTTHEESITRENISQWQKYFNVQSAGNKTSSPEISVFARALRSPNVQHGFRCFFSNSFYFSQIAGARSQVTGLGTPEAAVILVSADI